MSKVIIQLDGKVIQKQISLTKEQKEAVGLLSIGTFLEYFDLMLFVHMGVLLNELFFPKTDPHTTALYSATAFCSSFVFRPIGALIFGYIGDTVGRKSTIVITTFMMSISCIIMANLPTYEQIGVTAAWIITICRIIQGMSSMGEIVGAELYLIEITKPPVQYPTVALLGLFGSLGPAVALGVATLVTSFGFNWRIAFWIGAGIAVIGSLARTTLRETPEFADAKCQLKKTLAKVSNVINVDQRKVEGHRIWKEKSNKTTFLSVMLIGFICPVSFYFKYIYCAGILKNYFGYSSAQIIQHNFIISIILICWIAVIVYLSYYFHPLKILKATITVFTVFALVCPYLLNHISTPFELLLLQSFAILGIGELPAAPILYKHFPVFKRFSYASLTFALSRAVMYVITSFGVVYLTEYFGHWGLLIIMIPVILGYVFGLLHLQKLEKEAGNYP
ncbi:MFS transporter [Candidatus Tisiphia endosymbiont of Thecophora atra]|uniref:MFS transporter n=1 Tax=Candidatus Tisiphia endosymbiont of Thecophora atra TaxID=3066258 RepID=UPI00312CB1B4